ncbi:serine hydrolase, partial [Mycobacterium tuberculosis]
MKRSLRAAVLGLGLALPLFLPQFAAAQQLPTAKPEQVGLSTERLQMLTDVLKADVAAGKIPGAVLLVARQGKVAW